MTRYENIRQFVWVENLPFSVDTDADIDIALEAMREEGIKEAPVWHGHPDCTDSYRDPKVKVICLPMGNTTRNNRISIQYTARPNYSGWEEGWSPRLWVNGHKTGWGFRISSTRDEALADAKQAAQVEAARYPGDWDVTVRER